MCDQSGSNGARLFGIKRKPEKNFYCISKKGMMHALNFVFLDKKKKLKKKYIYMCIIIIYMLDPILTPHYQATLRQFLVLYIFLPFIALIAVSHVSNMDYVILVVQEN